MPQHLQGEGMVSTKLPRSARYIKNGRSGAWWKSGLAKGQLHAGWSEVSDELLGTADVTAITDVLVRQYGGRPGTTQDINALLTLLQSPSRHVWVTFESGFLWWCTVKDGITVNPAGQTRDMGHFWLTCDRPWTNRSLGGRLLAEAVLPGAVTTTKGFKGTVCTPSADAEILRLIHDEVDPDGEAAREARAAYEVAVLKLVRRLHPKDFELLVDLVLSRSGWVRIQKFGGQVEGLDIEAENPALGEIAFVQIKSKAGQATLNRYVELFADRRARYRRMMFVVHTAQGVLIPPEDPDVHVWSGNAIAALVVRSGLGDWVADRV